MLKLGRHSYAGPTENEETMDVEVGNFTGIGNHGLLIRSEHPVKTHPNLVSNFPFHEIWGSDYPACTTDAKIAIGNDVWIGDRVTILDGVTIADGCIIGTGAIVTKNTEPYGIYIGSPAHIYRYRMPPIMWKMILKIAWWNWDDEKIREALPYMINVVDFIEKYG